MTQIKHFNSKAILSGTILELYEYDETLYYNYTVKDFIIEKSKMQNNIDEKLNKNINDKSITDTKRDYSNETKLQAIKRAKRLIASNCSTDSNITPKFITLTFSDDITTFKDAQTKFRLFKERLDRQLRRSLKYFGVREYQQNGRVHYHLIYFNMPYIDVGDLKKIWKYGNVNIKTFNNTQNDYKNISKYMMKDFDNRLYKEKRYINSKGLKRPLELRNDFHVNTIQTIVDERWNYSYKNFNDYIGSYTIKAIDLLTLTENERASILDIAFKFGEEQN